MCNNIVDPYTTAHNVQHRARWSYICAVCNIQLCAICSLKFHWFRALRAFSTNSKIVPNLYLYVRTSERRTIVYDFFSFRKTKDNAISRIVWRILTQVSPTGQIHPTFRYLPRPAWNREDMCDKRFNTPAEHAVKNNRSTIFENSVQDF